jgi:hypothetical protein
VTVTAAADGYQSGTVKFTLVPSAVVFGSPQTTFNVALKAGVQMYSVSLQALNPSSLQPAGIQFPRPGASFTVTATSSDPTVASVDAAPISLSSQNPTVSVRPLKVGTTIITLSTIHGVMPASGGQLVINVTAN